LGRCGLTIIIARFVPIVRTFAPFMVGSGHMDYRRIMSFNVIGALSSRGSA
jgi:membrane-associated protein